MARKVLGMKPGCGGRLLRRDYGVMSACNVDLPRNIFSVAMILFCLLLLASESQLGRSKISSTSKR